MAVHLPVRHDGGIEAFEGLLHDVVRALLVDCFLHRWELALSIPRCPPAGVWRHARTCEALSSTWWYLNEKLFTCKSRAPMRGCCEAHGMASTASVIHFAAAAISSQRSGSVCGRWVHLVVDDVVVCGLKFQIDLVALSVDNQRPMRKVGRGTDTHDHCDPTLRIAAS